MILKSLPVFWRIQNSLSISLNIPNDLAVSHGVILCAISIIFILFSKFNLSVMKFQLSNWRHQSLCHLCLVHLTWEIYMHILITKAIYHQEGENSKHLPDPFSALPCNLALDLILYQFRTSTLHNEHIQILKEHCQTLSAFSHLFFFACLLKSFRFFRWNIVNYYLFLLLLYFFGVLTILFFHDYELAIWIGNQNYVFQGFNSYPCISHLKLPTHNDKFCNKSNWN